MDSLPFIEPWKLIVTIVTIILISLISFATNYWLTRRAYRAVSDREEEEEEDTRTPEELFQDKLLHEEYEAALEIARIHGLDSDLVYQRQWNKSDVTLDSIDNFLSKVNDYQWVLGECIERIPQELESNKYLLDFGIDLTETIADFEETDDFYELSNEQRQIVIFRKRLLQFRDRLVTFERIIGGNVINFNSNLYEKFRRQEIFESCLQFAREGDHRAMATLFTFHGAQTLEHWLPLLSQIPEVVAPFEYQSLLPEAGLSQNEEDVYAWEEVKPRDDDWCEKMVPDPSEDSPSAFYAANQHLIEYRGRQLTKSLVSKWFCVRSRQIERCTSLISHALELVQLGIERNFPDLAGLHARLDTFATLIYECLPRGEEQENSLTFETFSKLSSDEIVKLLMSGCKKDANTFIKCLRQSLLPYLIKYDSRHVEGRCQGSLENFLVECAKESLHFVRAVFEQSVVQESKHVTEESDGHFMNDNSAPIITNVKDLLNLASRCINECRNDEQFLSDAFAIIECLPQRSDSDPPEIKPLQDEIDTLENNLAVIELLEKNSCRVLMSELKSIQKNPKDVKRLFTEMIRKGSKRTGFKILEEDHWKQLLQEALQIRSDCFPTTITESEINEIFIKTLLSYGREENFDLAYNLLKNMDTGDLNQLILDCSRDYVNSAGSTGDKTIGLAKRCLNLLPKETLHNHPDMKEELDLISALEIIDEFWTLPLLPVQIRLMEQPRIQLIHHLLLHNKAYKQVTRVLQVAQLTRVCLECDSATRDGMVLIILGEAALDDEDYKSCWNVCEMLIDREYSDSWKLCLNLALNTSNLRQKMDLLSFSLTYCEEENSSGRRMNQILGLIEKTRHEMENNRNLLRGAVNDANLINLDVLTAGAQLGEEVVIKTASHLTSWLIPKLKSISNEAKIIAKPISNDKVGHEEEFQSKLNENMSGSESVAKTERKENQLSFDQQEREQVEHTQSLRTPTTTALPEKSDWDIGDDIELDSSELQSNPLPPEEEKEMIIKEEKDEKKPEKRDESGWDVDEELELDLHPELSTESLPKRSKTIEVKPVVDTEQHPAFSHHEELSGKPKTDQEPTSEEEIKLADQGKKSESGWEIDDELDVPEDTGTVTVTTKATVTAEVSDKEKNVPQNEAAQNTVSRVDGSGWEIDDDDLELDVKEESSLPAEVKKGVPHEDEEPSGWDIGDEELEIEQLPASMEESNVEASKPPEKTKCDVNSIETKPLDSGWDVEDEDLLLDEEESGWTHE